MPPPDENTAVDPTGTAWVVWLVIVGPSLLFATLVCVRRVGPGELVLVVRQGTVVRSRRHGLVARWPVEDFEVRSLVNDLEGLEARWHAEVTQQLPAGTRAAAVTVTEVEARLTPGGPA